MNIELTSFRGKIFFGGRPMVVEYSSDEGMLRITAAKSEPALQPGEAQKIVDAILSLPATHIGAIAGKVEKVKLEVPKVEVKKEEPKPEPKAEAKTANGTASRAEAQAEAIKKDIEAREAAKKDEPSDPAWMKQNTVTPKTDVEKKAEGWDLAGDGKGDDPGDRVDPKLDLAKGELPPEITGAGQIRKVIYFLRDRGWSTEDLLVGACEQLYARGVQVIVDAAKGNPATLRDRVHVVLANAPR